MTLLQEFWKEEDAVGVVEIILILVVLIGLVIIFKEQLNSLVKNILSKITNSHTPLIIAISTVQLPLSLKFFKFQPYSSTCHSQE